MNINKDECWICRRTKEELKGDDLYIYEETISVPQQRHDEDKKQHVYTVNWLNIPICNVCEELIMKISGKYDDEQ